MGKICVCGAAEVQINYAKRTMKIGNLNFKEGDFLSIDGNLGEIYPGEVKTAPSEVIQGLLENKAAAKRSRTYKNFKQIMDWSAKATKMQVRTNADTPGQVKNAVSFGATGIGLCRTEHMFFEGNRIDAVREMILAENEKDRRKAVKKLLPYQRKDFEGIFKALAGLPATIRLLDPPLHEFLPHDSKQIADLAKKLKVKPAEIQKRVHELHEFNPMLGHRGCRLAISYPEIAEMQVRAIFEAAANVQKKKIKVNPEIMVPLVGFSKELELQAEIIHRVAKEVQGKGCETELSGGDHD